MCYHALGAVLFQLGRWDESRAALEKSVELARSFNGAFGELLGEQRIAQIEVARGQFDAARARLERIFVAGRASREPMVRAHAMGRIIATLALAEFRAGNLQAATRHLARGYATQRVVGDCAGCDVHLYPPAVEIYLAHGDLALAEEAARKADETAGAFRSQAWLATGRYLLALVAEAQGDAVTAQQWMEDALDRFERIAQPYEIARVSESLAAVVTDQDRAGALRERARDLLAQLGGSRLDSRRE